MNYLKEKVSSLYKSCSKVRPKKEGDGGVVSELLENMNVDDINKD